MSAKIRVYATAKNRAALGIAAAFLRLFPATSLAELNAAFKKDEITALGYVTTIFVDVKDADKIVNSIGQNRFANYYMTDEFIALADGSEVAALKTWSVETFAKLAARAAEFGIEVGEFQSAAHFQRGHFRLEILDPALDDAHDGLTPDAAAAPLDDELAKIQRASLDAVFSNAVEALGDGASGDFGGADGENVAGANSNSSGGVGEKPSVSQQDFQDIFNIVVSRPGKPQSPKRAGGSGLGELLSGGDGGAVLAGGAGAGADFGGTASANSNLTGWGVSDGGASNNVSAADGANSNLAKISAQNAQPTTASGRKVASAAAQNGTQMGANNASNAANTNDEVGAIGAAQKPAQTPAKTISPELAQSSPEMGILAQIQARARPQHATQTAAQSISRSAAQHSAQPQQTADNPPQTAPIAPENAAQTVPNSNLAEDLATNATQESAAQMAEIFAQTATAESALVSAIVPEPEPAPALTPERKPTRAELKEARAAGKKAAKYETPRYDIFANEARDRVFGLVCAVVLIAAVAAFFIFVKPML